MSDQRLTDAELAAIEQRHDNAHEDMQSYSAETLHLQYTAMDVPRLLAELRRTREEQDGALADLLQYSHMHWEDCPLDEEDCYLCEGYERIRANARDRKAAHDE